MPGFDQQGPLGSGPLTGQKRGMCKRTEDLSLPGNANRGRRMGGERGRSRNQPGGRIAQRNREFTQAEEPAIIGSNISVEKELAKLKNQYQDASATLTKIAKEIEALEAMSSKNDPKKT